MAAEPSDAQQWVRVYSKPENTEGEGYSYKPIEIQSGSKVTLKAMQGADAGIFDGMLFWVDRNVAEFPCFLPARLLLVEGWRSEN